VNRNIVRNRLSRLTDERRKATREFEEQNAKVHSESHHQADPSRKTGRSAWIDDYKPTTDER